MTAQKIIIMRFFFDDGARFNSPSRGIPQLVLFIGKILYYSTGHKEHKHSSLN
jgi:hypothetical protein